ncbi:MAG: alpha/beta hydrolase family protein [Candidatus Sulfotelmatobacter sp.]
MGSNPVDQPAQLNSSDLWSMGYDRSSMQTVRPSRVPAACFALLLMLSTACHKNEPPPPDRPRLTPNVTMRDVTFHSDALDRDMPYRVVLPVSIVAGQTLPVVYLLHGGGGGFREWSNDSDVAQFAERGLILVMPEGNSSYYTNSVQQPQDRYEDYIVSDLIRDVESRFPAAAGRSNRAIVGVSMGGYGAVTLAMRHPGLFAFAGGLSSAIDVPRRAFTIKRLQQSRHYESIFWASGSPARRDRDPFVLFTRANPEAAPYFFLTCGEQEGLMPANREFAALLARRHFRYEFHSVPGGHNWNQWNAWLPDLFRSLMEHLGPGNAPGKP